VLTGSEPPPGKVKASKKVKRAKPDVLTTTDVTLR
jgi:hypothetical protein